MNSADMNSSIMTGDQKRLTIGIRLHYISLQWYTFWW